MNDIRFWYPVPSDKDNPFSENSIIRKEGSIRVINLEQEPYEISVDANGYGFHLIFGSQINGKFLCIPNWNMGCELGPYQDRIWNVDSIIKTGQLGHDEAYAIGNALDLISFMIKNK